MPIVSQVDASRQLVRATFIGSVTRAEIVDYFRDVAEEPAYSPEFDRLIDWREMHDIPSADVHMLAHLILQSTGNIVRPTADRRALIVRRGAQFGLARMLQIILDVASCAAELRLFHDAERAEAWLAERLEAAPVS